jgi:hypothetical protein
VFECKRRVEGVREGELGLERAVDDYQFNHVLVVRGLSSSGGSSDMVSVEVCVGKQNMYKEYADRRHPSPSPSC